ncbi:HAMP domain-containing sensor histidine kinase [Sulfitobacter sp. HNIBRBA3233]|uniref:sensor histidine kinase n=1 Tax=Sulfitobacter marinivivus TaxID=3158558 RepID=UPI0032E038AC
MTHPLRLSQLAVLWVTAAMLAGVLSATLWYRSAQAWNSHLTDAYEAGFRVFEALRSGADPGMGLNVSPLPPDLATLAEAGAFDRLPGAPQPAFITLLSLQSDSGGVQIGVVSDKLRYPVADIRSGTARSAAAELADLTRLFATYCSDPILYARLGRGAWTRVDGTALWGCAAAPKDWRLVAAGLAVLALAAIVTHIGNTTAAFDTFARALRMRQRLGGPDSYDANGPAELRDIVAAVNSYLGAERDQLARRAGVLSGVSHDLGTPATRLRLRAALIEDADLRRKLEADIDRMTGLIDSVLTYTRAETSGETARELSLTSLLDAIVEDYRDTGAAVSLRAPRDTVVSGAPSIFGAARGHATLSGDRQIIVTGRPIALERAVSNLVDNALKYGRRATVGWESTADTATILVEDEGTDVSAAEVESLIDPFKRGDGVEAVDGHGLGLTIVATIAQLHSGTLRFEDTQHGLRARLTIRRTG